MNLRKYYERVQEIRQTLPDGYVHLTSVETPNGGKPGLVCEVDKETAARMIADGVAKVSTTEEVEDFRAAQVEARLKVHEEELRSRLRITLMKEPSFETESEEARPKARK